MPRDLRKYLHDIVEACSAIEQIAADSSLETYQTVRQTRSSIEREFIIIGEALRRAIDLDPSIEHNVSEAATIIGFRNQLIHGYDVIKDEVVWRIIENDVAVLAKEAQKLLAALGG